ncbi:AAA family ATPase [Candidatus Babeliales bacterium]|nr:AAA family ATPase [Candidatus Babeliales bacterium]
MKNFSLTIKITLLGVIGIFLLPNNVFGVEAALQQCINQCNDAASSAARASQQGQLVINQAIAQLPNQMATALVNAAVAQHIDPQVVGNAIGNAMNNGFGDALQQAMQPVAQAMNGVSTNINRMASNVETILKDQEKKKTGKLLALAEILTDPVKVGLIAGAIGSVTFAVKVLTPWVKSKIGKPKIIQSSSRTSWFSSSKKKESRLGEIIMKPDLRKQLMEIVSEIQNAQATGTGLFNVLLYGPPGTGKTMFAEALALESGIDFEMTSGSRFVQLAAGKDVQALNELIDYAEKSSREVLIFIDEAQSLLADRYAFGVEKRARDLTEAFLARVPKPTNDKFMFVFATNHPEQLDSAAWDRTKGHQIEVGLPEAHERAKIFNMYLKKFSLETGTPISKSLKYETSNLAANMPGFSARSIEEVARGIIRKTIERQEKAINFEISKEVIDRQISEDKKQQKRLEMLKKKRQEMGLMRTIVAA